MLMIDINGSFTSLLDLARKGKDQVYNLTILMILLTLVRVTKEKLFINRLDSSANNFTTWDSMISIHIKADVRDFISERSSRSIALRECSDHSVGAAWEWPPTSQPSAVLTVGSPRLPADHPLHAHPHDRQPRTTPNWGKCCREKNLITSLFYNKL